MSRIEIHRPVALTIILMAFGCMLPEVHAGKARRIRIQRPLAAQENEKRELAGKLLDRAPVLREKSDRLSDRDFINQTKDVVENPGLDTRKESIIALEAMFAEAGDVTATVKSLPDKLDVEYRRYVDDKGPWLSTTTNGAIKVRPALYVFKCRKDGKEKQKTVSCSTDCEVQFVFDQD